VSMIPPQPDPFKDPMKTPALCDKCSHALVCIFCATKDAPMNAIVLAQSVGVAGAPLQDIAAQTPFQVWLDIQLSKIINEGRNVDSGHELLLRLAHGEVDEPTMLTERELCAIIRQFFRVPITTEGQSGPEVRAWLTRVRATIGRALYDEYTADDWPKRL